MGTCTRYNCCLSEAVLTGNHNLFRTKITSKNITMFVHLKIVYFTGMESQYIAQAHLSNEASDGLI